MSTSVPASASYDAIAQVYDTKYSTPHETAENWLIASQMRKWRMFDLPPAPAFTRIQHVIPVASTTGADDRRYSPESSAPCYQYLDIGCGTGLAVELSRLADKPLPPSRYLGIDPSAGMLQQARKKFPEYKFVLGDAERAYQWGKFDRISALFGPLNYADPKLSFPALANATNDRAILAIIVYTEAYQKSEKYILNDAPPFTHFFTAEKLNQHLKNVGFHVDNILGISPLSFYAERDTPLGLRLSLRRHFRTIGKNDPDANSFLIARARKL